MKLILASDSVLWDPFLKRVYPGIKDAIATTIQNGNYVFMVSGHPEPNWLKSEFPNVTYASCPKRDRMTGKIVKDIVTHNAPNGLKISDVVVLGGKKNDLLMAVGSQTLLLRCGWWSDLDDCVGKYGLPIPTPTSIPKLVSLLKDDAPWYFKQTTEKGSVFALTDAGTIGETSASVKKLKDRLKDCLKFGALVLKDEFTAHFMSSVCATSIFREVDVWGWYPSSSAGKENTEVMSHFCDLARTTFGHRTKGPLFVRHKDTTKRTYLSDGRTDPTTELESIHINPAYRGRLEGKTVAVFDDFLTYGLSFGVASYLLEKAGAARVIAVAMGKFGNRAGTYQIRLPEVDVYAPIKADHTSIYSPMTGTQNYEAQTDFVKKFINLL